MPDYSLTELQLDIMRILWERREATVQQVHGALHPQRGLAQATVATLLSRMEKKGVVAHRTEGRQFVYRPEVEEPQVRRSVVAEFTELADRLFRGDTALLVSHLLEVRDVDSSELARVRELIEAREAELREQEGGR